MQHSPADSWRWGPREWDFFISDLEGHLAPGGRIFFELNAAYKGKYFTPEILEVFLRHDGVLERGSVLFSPRLPLANKGSSLTEAGWRRAPDYEKQ